MDTTRAETHDIATLLQQQDRWLRHIARQNAHLIRLIEGRRTGRLRAFLRKMWSAFSEKLATNIGHWAAGLPLWLLALEGLGLRQLLERLLG